MIKKVICTLIITVFLAIIAFLGFQTFQGRASDVFFEVVIFTGVNPNGNVRAYRFIVTNDKTLISIQGIARNHLDVTRGSIMRFIQNRYTISLTEQDFQLIIELVANTVENRYRLQSLSQWRTYLLYNGNIYTLFNELENEIIRLSPLDVR